MGGVERASRWRWPTRSVAAVAVLIGLAAVGCAGAAPAATGTPTTIPALEDAAYCDALRAVSEAPGPTDADSAETLRRRLAEAASHADPHTRSTLAVLEQEAERIHDAYASGRPDLVADDQLVTSEGMDAHVALGMELVRCGIVVPSSGVRR